MSKRSKELISGVLWIVFSPLALLMGLIAKTPTLTEYYVGVGLTGAWSISGVISGFGRIAGTRWALRVQMVLCWIAVALYSVSGIAMVFFIVKTRSSFGVSVAVGTLLTATPFLFCARRCQRQLRQASDIIG